jgi:hypothetical protein
VTLPAENQQTVEALAERIERLIDRYTGAPWQKRAYEAGTLGAFESGQAARAALRDLVAQADREYAYAKAVAEIRGSLTALATGGISEIDFAEEVQDALARLDGAR